MQHRCLHCLFRHNMTTIKFIITIRIIRQMKAIFKAKFGNVKKSIKHKAEKFYSKPMIWFCWNRITDLIFRVMQKSLWNKVYCMWWLHVQCLSYMPLSDCSYLVCEKYKFELHVLSVMNKSRLYKNIIKNRKWQRRIKWYQSHSNATHDDSHTNFKYNKT